MQHPEEGTIHSWLDGELTAEDAAGLEAHIAGCAECAATVAEARGLIAAASRIVRALDVVPAGVIPAAAPRPRAWYWSPQLRAAAALVVVAGGSFLVLRGEGDVAEDRIMPARSAVSAETGMASPSGEEASTLEQDATVPSPAPATPLRKQASDMSGAAQSPSPASSVVAASPSGSSAGAAATEKPQAAADEASAQRKERRLTAEGAASASGNVTARQDSSRVRALSGSVSGVTVTGMTMAAVQELRVVRTDTLGTSARTTYSVSQGVEVTLTESAGQGFSVMRAPASKATAQSARTQANIPAPAAPPAVAPAPPIGAGHVINSISWVQKATGRIATLSGPMSKEELEALREKLPPAKREGVNR